MKGKSYRLRNRAVTNGNTEPDPATAAVDPQTLAPNRATSPTGSKTAEPSGKRTKNRVVPEDASVPPTCEA